MFGIKNKSTNLIMETRSLSAYKDIKEGFEAVEHDGIKAGGTLVNGVFTKKDNSQDELRSSVWAEARTDYIENGMDDSTKFKRCVKSGSIDSMDDSCWTNLIAAYPQN